MNLGTQIRETVNNFRETFPDALNQLVEQGAGEISAMDIVENALKLGNLAPNFSLSDRHNKSFTQTNLLQQGPLVITFYRGAWCPYCNLQLAAYNSILNEIRSLGANLVAVTPERPDAVEAFLACDVPQEAKNSVIKDPDFPVLQDFNNQLARQYGLVFELPDAHKKRFELNLDIEKLNGESRYSLPDPATYIIDQTGVIRWAFVPNNYRKRAEPAEL